MTDKTVNPHEKSHLESKKFVAFLVVELGLFALMGLTIFRQELNTLGGQASFMVLAVTAGFVAVGFILGQASLDRYVRVAQITMSRGTSSPPETEEEKKENE
jgi:hypothetical protein